MDVKNDKKRLIHTMSGSFFGLRDGGKQFSTKIVTLMGMFIALCIVFERVIYIPIGDISRYSFSFVATTISCVVLGGLKGMIVVVLADIIGSLIVYGNVCPLITICVAISALFFGILLYKKNGVVRIIIVVLIDQIVCSLFLKTGALAIWYYGGLDMYVEVFMTRLVQILIMIPLEILVLVVLDKYFFGYLNKLIKDYVA